MELSQLKAVILNHLEERITFINKEVIIDFLGEETKGNFTIKEQIQHQIIYTLILSYYYFAVIIDSDSVIAVLKAAEKSKENFQATKIMAEDLLVMLGFKEGN